MLLTYWPGCGTDYMTIYSYMHTVHMHVELLYCIVYCRYYTVVEVMYSMYLDKLLFAEMTI